LCPIHHISLCGHRLRHGGNVGLEWNLDIPARVQGFTRPFQLDVRLVKKGFRVARARQKCCRCASKHCSGMRAGHPVNNWCRRRETAHSPIIPMFSVIVHGSPSGICSTFCTGRVRPNERHRVSVVPVEVVAYRVRRLGTAPKHAATGALSPAGFDLVGEQWCAGQTRLADP